MATTYLDRVRELVYTSPSGREFRPLWDDAERSRGKKVAVDEIPQADGAIVQDLGSRSREFRLECYFSGPDYDTLADAFDAALSERGAGKLQHPVYGDLRVQLTEESEVRHFVDGLGRASFALVFIEARDFSATGSANTAAAIQATADLAATEAASSLTVAADNASDLAKLKDKLRRQVKSISRKLGAMTASVESTRRDIEDAGRTFDRTLDTLVGTPLALGQSVLGLVRSVPRTALGVKAKVDGYAGLIAETITGLAAIPLGVANVVGFLACALIIALIESIADGDLDSRSEALSSLDAIEDALAAALAALDYMSATVPGYIPDAALLAYIAELRAKASAYLLAATYSLPSERRITLDAETTPLHLAARLYGDPERAGDIIAENNLQGDAIYVIPAGREVVYYA